MRRLYHLRKLKILWVALALVSLIWLAGCAEPRPTQSTISVSIQADDQVVNLQMPVGSTVQDTISRAAIVIGPLDRLTPASSATLGDGTTVVVVRVREEFSPEHQVIPFQRQLIRNETLPQGETRLSQPGANGLQEVIYRILYEDGVEISRSIVKSTVLEEPVPEIILVGTQTPFQSVRIPGRLVYLSAGNAWVMEGTTGNRRPVVTSGDLDGRVFTLSPDGEWLLYTRSNDDPEHINGLWAAQLDPSAPVAVDLKAYNIIHFAAFSPDNSTAAFSTVEPRSTAPGWQANNDLVFVTLSSGGSASKPELVLDSNSGGVYGWWGMNFSWSPDGKQLAYARPDAVGLVDPEEGSTTNLLPMLPFQSGGDWAWVPGMSWGPDGQVIYTVVHTAASGDPASELSPQFDLAAINLSGGGTALMVSHVGMFAYPAAGPYNPETGEYLVAYLQANNPLQSETSRYSLVLMDRDGSNKSTVFPEEGGQGLEPQRVVWSPLSEGESTAGTVETFLSFIYQNNIWLFNLDSGQVQQITGDGLITRLDWR